MLLYSTRFSRRSLSSAIGIGLLAGILPVAPDILFHPTRGKRSIGLALEHPGALDLLYELTRRSDVFLTNFLPEARERLRIEPADLRRVNPRLVYAKGHGQGQKGPDANRGGYVLGAVGMYRLVRSGLASIGATRGRARLAAWLGAGIFASRNARPIASRLL